MDNPFFSIIIPVYNLENYIKECLESIVKQNFNNYEVIIINDGSNDRSDEICLDYCNNNPNFHYSYQENQGLSETRNNGFKKAKGKYIIFIDGDDYIIYTSAFNDIFNAITTNHYPDIIFHEESRYFSENTIHYENNIKLFSPKQSENILPVLGKLIYDEIIVASAWDKIIKREVLQRNNILFQKHRKSEDMLWVSDLLPHVQSYLLFPNSIYMYRQNRIGSITTSVNEKHIYDIFDMLEIGLLKNKQYNLTFQKSLEYFWAEHYVFMLMNFNIITNENKEKFLNSLKKHEYLLVEGATKNVDKVYKFYKYVGLKNTIVLLNFFRLINNVNKKYHLF